MATATLRNIITSSNARVVSRASIGKPACDVPSRPWRMAASVTSSVLSMKTSPPHARKKLPSASVGGREGRMERGGLSQRKKYVRQRKTEEATSRFPQSV